MPSKTSVFFVVLLTLVVLSVFVKADRLGVVLEKVTTDIIELAQKVEDLYGRRCDEERMKDCEKANYGEYRKDYPNQQCMMEDPSYKTSACSSEDSKCHGHGFWDFTVSTVRYPKAQADGYWGNPKDPSLIEAICFSRYLDGWFMNKYDENKEYWKGLGFEPPGMYFGSHTGAFRIFPARQSLEEWGEYDPRLRPWYVAGSSGPKNIVLILDLARSLGENSRIDMLKAAAERIVSTLTVSDHVVVVPFNETAVPITDNGYLFEATKANKENLTEQISKLTAGGGGSNYSEGFLKAFEVLNTSIAQKRIAECNTAILFLTDGVSYESTDVLENLTLLVSGNIKILSDRLKRPVLLFTYSIASENEVYTFPKKLACSTDYGLWSKIDNKDEIVDALSSYYLLLAQGLGSGSTQNFVAWVEPYHYATTQQLGTTISAPVFDRNKTPPVFLGVVGIDILMDPLMNALAEENTNSTEVLRNESIVRINEASSNICPKLSLSLCDMEAYRYRSLDNDGRCDPTNCSGVNNISNQDCPAVFNISEVMKEPKGANLSYQDRACCNCIKAPTSNGTGEPTDVISNTPTTAPTTAPTAQTNPNSAVKPDDTPRVGIIVGIVVAVVAVCMFIGVGVKYFGVSCTFFANRDQSDQRDVQRDEQPIPINNGPALPLWWTGGPLGPLAFGTPPVVPPESEDTEAVLENAPTAPVESEALEANLHLSHVLIPSLRPRSHDKTREGETTDTGGM